MPPGFLDLATIWAEADRIIPAMEYEPLPDDAGKREERSEEHREGRSSSPFVALRRKKEGRVQSRPDWRGWLRSPWGRRALPLVAALVVGAIGGVVVAAAINIPQVDNLDDFTPGMITRVFDSRGEPFAEFARQKRILLKEHEVPEVLQNAVVALEDAKFFQHGGIDAVGVVRAAVTNFRTGKRGEGASTITMQLARTLFLSREKSWSRKIEEALTAVELEKRFTKQQILTLYCNLINLGHGNYGMAQAARFYFDKNVGELELHEAAMIAGIPQRPSDYSPYRRPELVRSRRDWVLKRMRAEGYINDEELEAALTEPLGVVPQHKEDPFAAYFAEEIRQHVESTYGTDALLEGGLQVHTTLDPAIQRAAEDSLKDGLVRLDHRKGWRGPKRSLEEGFATAELDSWPGGAVETDRWYEGIVLSADARKATVRIDQETFELTPEGMKWTRRRQPNQILKAGDVAWFRLEAPKTKEGKEEGEPTLMLEQEPQVEGAVIVLESATGAVRALVGGWDFDRSKFDRATQAKRQVGSAFKTFVWGAGLEAGYTAADTLFDAPTYFLGADNKPDYRPRNFGREYYGIVTLRRALEKSMNMTAVKLMDMVGVERTIDFARRCGVAAELQPYPSLALGVSEMTPMELAAAYAAIANQGTYVQPYMVEKVVSPSGQTLDETLPETRSATAPETAFILTRMLQGVVDRGTGTDLKDLPLELAGKTGTTDDFSDAWFVGYTPRYTILVWVGYDQRRSLGRNMTGAEAAVPVWRSIIEAGLEEGWLLEGEEMAPPPGVHEVPVERFTGLLAGPPAEQVILETFVRGTEPAQAYDRHWQKVMALPWFQQRPFYLPKEGERMPEDFEDVARLDERSYDD